MNQWKEMALGEAVLLNPKIGMSREQVYPFVEMAAITAGQRGVGPSEYRKLSGGSRFAARDTLVARITPCLENGKVARYLPNKATDGIAFGSTEFIVIRGREGVTDNDFAYYLTSLPEFRQFAISQMNGSSGRQRVSWDSLSGFVVNLPPLPTQKAIAHVLGTLDDKIELNRRMNATLEGMAKAVFREWFVDGVAGGLPEGWREVAIEEICAINAWTLGKKDELDLLEYVEISEVNRGDIANIATYARGDEPSRARRRLRHGDTVLSTVRPDRGAYFLALNPPENRVASTGFAVITPEKVPWSFIHAALTQDDFSEHLGKMADGGAYPAVRPEVIGAWKIVLPDRHEMLDDFHRICAPLFEKAEANRVESRNLAELRDLLLPNLLSGEFAPDEEAV